MSPNLSTVYLPVRPLPSVSDNSIKRLEVMDAQGVLESCTDLDKMRAEARQKSYLVWSGIVSDNVDEITHFEIKVASGESVFLKCEGFQAIYGKFCATAIRHRDVKIFLVSDPFDERVIEASRKVGRSEQNKVFVLADEVPGYAERIRSFHPLLPDLQGADVKDLMTRLASKGFYLKDGFVRCNGCEYRKTLAEFTEIINSSGSCLTSILSFLQPVLGTNDAFEHDDGNCYLAGTDKKTFLRVSHRLDPKVDGGFSEQGHFLVCQDNDRNYIQYHSYIKPWPYKTLKEQYARSSANGFCDKLADRFLNHDRPSYLFITRVPKSEMLSQDDLIYEASEIKTDLDRLRQKYKDFQNQVDQLSDHNPGLAKALNLPAVQSLLSPEIGMLFARIIFKIGERSARMLLCHDKQGLGHLLEQLLTFIEHQGGDVGDNGLKCLGIYADENDAEDPFGDFAALSAQGEISPMQQQWQELQKGFNQAITSRILDPLREIFTTQELGDRVLCKIFGVSVDPVPPPVVSDPAPLMFTRRRKAS